jgi:hypothetical protein
MGLQTMGSVHGSFHSALHHGSRALAALGQWLSEPSSDVARRHRTNRRGPVLPRTHLKAVINADGEIVGVQYAD